MRSDVDRPVAEQTDKYRAALLERVAEWGVARASVRATLPFALVPKRPKRPEEGRRDKVRTGIHQSYRRYRPLVLTGRELFVFDTGRTPQPRELLARFPVDQVRVVSAAPGRFGTVTVVLDLPGEGPVPFETGRREREDLTVLLAQLGGGSA
ncbi:MAG TPA: hypothetical protein VH986_00530 [Acidimicrobiia bacterium]|jgi:hypothetical protein